MKSRFFLAVVLVAGLLIPNLSAQSSSADLSKFFAAYFEERLRDSPEFATNVGRHEYDDRWSDFSKAGRDRRRAAPGAGFGDGREIFRRRRLPSPSRTG